MYVLYRASLHVASARATLSLSSFQDSSSKQQVGPANEVPTTTTRRYSDSIDDDAKQVGSRSRPTFSHMDPMGVGLEIEANCIATTPTDFSYKVKPNAAVKVKTTLQGC